MWPATLLALGAAVTAAAPPASALGPSPTGLYDCAVQQELGCFRSGFAFNNASSVFERTANRDRSANAATGNSPRRCAARASSAPRTSSRSPPCPWTSS